MASQLVTRKDKYYGLPTFPEHEGKRYTAIVTGANGISGAYITRVLAESSQRWSRIFALSRRPPSSPLSENVKSLSVDFLSEPEEIADILRKEQIQADYVFFTSYIQPPPKESGGVWSNAEELERLNLRLLSNFLTALKLANKVPKRFLLQTGGKQYGLQYGPTLTPMEESDPRFREQPNFYFPQEDLLFRWCRENNTSWNVTRPGYILGAVRDAAMNVTYPLALYASVQKELGKGLDFPGDIVAWEAEKHNTASRIIGYHAEWVVLTESAANQAFNIVNGDLFSYGKFWPLLAAAYEVPYGIPQVNEDEYQVTEMPVSPPPRGFGGPGKLRSSWSFEQWAGRDDVKEAWTHLKARYKLDIHKDPFAPENVQAFFGLLDGEILTPWSRSMSMTESRKRGWNGFVETDGVFFEVIEGFVELKMLPPVELKKVEKGNVRYYGY